MKEICTGILQQQDAQQHDLITRNNRDAKTQPLATKNKTESCITTRPPEENTYCTCIRGPGPPGWESLIFDTVQYGR
jgi:hypothetical protein